MPTYEYECESCGYRFEKSQSMTELPIRKCPKCRKKIRRLIGAGSGILFKGSGFYQTDYRSESYKKKAESEKPKTSGAASDSKSEKPKINSAASDSKKSNPSKDSSASPSSSHSPSEKKSKPTG